DHLEWAVGREDALIRGYLTLEAVQRCEVAQHTQSVARSSDRRRVNAVAPGDADGRIVGVRPAGRVAERRARQIEEHHAGRRRFSVHSSGDLADQRADHVTPHVEISPELPVALRPQARLLDVRLGGLQAGRLEHRPDQLRNALPRALTIHVGGARPREAVVAEAHSQQVADVWTQWEEAAPVVTPGAEW